MRKLQLVAGPLVRLALLACAALPAALPAATSGEPDRPGASPEGKREVSAAAPEALGAEQIVERSIAARGGLSAWRQIESLMWVGHLESERIAQHRLAFRLAERRPNKTRFEILGDHPSMRVFDGARGWKVHTRSDGMPEVDSFTPLEERFAREAPGLDGPLLGARARGRPVVLLGHDLLEGRDCYRLGVLLPSGDRETVWVDAETFLEARFDRPTYNREGSAGRVSIYFRDYRVQGGLQLPTLLEIGGAADKPDRLVVERVALNPQLETSFFDRPASAPHSGHVAIPPQELAPSAPRPIQPGAGMAPARPAAPGSK